MVLLCTPANSCQLACVPRLQQGGGGRGDSDAGGADRGGALRQLSTSPSHVRRSSRCGGLGGGAAAPATRRCCSRSGCRPGAADAAAAIPCGAAAQRLPLRCPGKRRWCLSVRMGAGVHSMHTWGGRMYVGYADGITCCSSPYPPSVSTPRPPYHLSSPTAAEHVQPALPLCAPPPAARAPRRQLPGARR